MQEFRAGRVQGDVLGNSPEPLLYLKQQGVLGQRNEPVPMNMVSGIGRCLFAGGNDAENSLSRSLVEVPFVETQEQGFLDLTRRRGGICS
jgi:hypothetical protein